jgi:capsular exopolysaccharide synthesis family protein
MTHGSDDSQVDLVENQRTSSFPNVWETAWQHKLLLALGLTVGLVLAALYRAQKVPEYLSSTKVLLIKKRPDPLPLPGTADPRVVFMEEYLATHQVLLRSPLIVGDAVKRGKLNTLPSFADNPDPTHEIMGALGVTRETTEGGAANILNISYRSRVSEDCATVIHAIVDSYRAFLETTFRNVSEDTFKLITNAKDVLENGLNKKEQEYRAFRLAHPVLWKGKGGLTVWQDRLFNIESKRSALQLQQVELEQRLATFENAVNSGQTRESLLAMIADNAAKQVGEGSRRASVEREDPLKPLLFKERALLQDFGPRHPQVQSLRDQIEYIRATASRPAEDDDPLDPIKAHKAFLKRELETIKNSMEALAKMADSERAEAQKLVAQEIQDDSLHNEIAREQQLFESVLKRLQEINLLKDIGGYDLQVLSPAGPGGRLGEKTVPILVVGGVLGLFCGLGLAFLAEISDKSFRNPEEVRRLLGLPIVGQIPFLKQADKTVQPDQLAAGRFAPSLCTLHSPKSREAESYRGVRTGLFFSTQAKGHKVIQVTSPSSGDGKSTLAANLAISISQARKNVLLIDADFRRPTIHQLFDLTPKCGLGSVIIGETEPGDAIVPSGVPALSILPAGPVPPNPAELLSLPGFKELLAHLREQYDFVIIDTPPLLAVTDPCMVVPHTDGVLLTLRISKQNRPNALRAKEILTTLGATIVGVVVNAIKHGGKGLGYGYGYYGYGDGYGTHYYHQEKEKPLEPVDKNQAE